MASAAARAGIEARLVHTGGPDTGFASGGRHNTILDELATATTHPDGGAPLAVQLRHLGLGGDGGTVVAFTSDAATEEELGALVRSAGHGQPLTLVVVERDARRTPAPPSAGRTGVTMVWVPSGTSFAAAWDRALAPARAMWSGA